MLQPLSLTLVSTLAGVSIKKGLQTNRAPSLMFEQCHEVVLPSHEQSPSNGEPLFGLTVSAGSGL